MYREHPLRIMRYSLKNIWLLIFPIIRGATVIHFDPAGVYAWLKGAWLDIAIIGVILLFGFVQWYFSRITITEKEVIHTNGMIIKMTTTIPIENISAVSSERLFFLIPLKAMTFRCDTRAGIFRSTDMKLLVTMKVGAELMAHIPKLERQKGDMDFPQPTPLSVLLFSVFFSSGFSGTVYIATFFFKGGDIAHDIVSEWIQRITETTERISEKLLLRIPQTGILIGIFFITTWLLSFIVNLLRYSRFRVSADRKYINISCGITKRKEYRLRVDYINYTNLRQNLIMKICGAVTVNISCAGYGSSKQLPVLLPMRKENDIGIGLGKICMITKKGLDFRPRKSAFITYTLIPFLGIVSLYVLYRLADKYIPQLSELSLFLLVMGEIPLVWLMAVKIMALLKSGITIRDGNIIVCSSSGTSFHTVIAKTEKIVNIEKKQTIFQRISNKKCHLSIWFMDESKSVFTVKALDVEDVEKICNLL